MEIFLNVKSWGNEKHKYSFIPAKDLPNLPYNLQTPTECILPPFPTIDLPFSSSIFEYTSFFYITVFTESDRKFWCLVDIVTIQSNSISSANMYYVGIYYHVYFKISCQTPTIPNIVTLIQKCAIGDIFLPIFASQHRRLT